MAVTEMWQREGKDMIEGSNNEGRISCFNSFDREMAFSPVTAVRDDR